MSGCCDPRRVKVMVNHAIKRIGMLLGAAASAVMGGNEVPLRALTGLMVAWSYNSCRRQLTAPPPPPPPSPCEVDPCSCCDSEFEPFIKDQFEGCSNEGWDEKSKPETPPPQEETGSCNCKPAQRAYDPSNTGPRDHGECADCTCDGV